MTADLALARRGGAIAIVIAAATFVAFAIPASAAQVATVQLGTSANYSVLGGSTVTNTGNTTLGRSLGVWPGSSITGFPPGKVLAPGTTDKTNAAAKNAQSNLTAAYLNAAGRAIDATTAADLSGRTLQGGVYAGPGKGALGLTGKLTLDGAGDANSVFIFQTNSTLITGSGSTVALINGAQACNVFWQVGSSATLGTGSTFVGNILALTSISVNRSVTVHGRALARNGGVTLIGDTFTASACVTSASVTTTVAAATAATTAATAATTTPAISTTAVTRLPRTGSSTTLPLAGIAVGLCACGLGMSGVAKRRRATN